MTLRYSVGVSLRQPLPAPRLPFRWLLTDARNDAGLEDAIARLPAGSAVVFRHYHLAPPDRIARFEAVQRLCHAGGHVLILADSAMTAREWGADGVYGAPRALYPARGDMLTVATAHSVKEIGDANRCCADAVMLSPVFTTRSHPGAPVLGAVRFRLLASRALMPVIALGGMDAKRAQALDWPRFAAIDGLS